MKTIDVFTPITRADIENTYYVSCIGEILTYGKFYACPVYVPFIWSIYTRGGYDRVVTDRVGDRWGFVKITDVMRAEFPELRSVREVGVREEKKHVLYWVISVHCTSPL